MGAAAAAAAAALETHPTQRSPPCSGCWCRLFGNYDVSSKLSTEEHRERETSKYQTFATYHSLNCTTWITAAYVKIQMHILTRDQR
eukprot:scaffold75610_cov16-Tisochrysis_lutea.AAC.1